MLSPDQSTEVLERLFERERVVALADLFKVLGTNSRMTVFRRLSPLGYLSSYNRAGRFYTLRRISSFDEYGLWQHRGALFSTHGSLKSTACHLIDRSRAGCTHEELRAQLRVRVHNALLQLWREKRISREEHESAFLYLSASAKRAASQRKERVRRGADQPSMRVEPFLVIEVLVEVIHGAGIVPEPADVAARLMVRGISVTSQLVEAVFQQHGLRKKTAHSRSTPSNR